MSDGSERDALIVRAYEVHNVAKKAASDDLLQMFKKVSDNTKAYTFKRRFKDSTAIEGKVRRKRREGQKLLESLNGRERDDDYAELYRIAQEMTGYMADHVTDILGCRFVTLYQSDIPVVVSELLNAIEQFNSDRDHEEITGSEFVIYTNRPSKDPLSITETTLEIVKASPLFETIGPVIRKPENRKSAYSSVHFVFERDVRIQHAGKPEVTETASIEVQIRDIFEEGWSEVQHSLLYSDKDREEAALAGDARQRAEWSLHLNALKTFVDGCSQHASIIKSNLDMLRAATTPSTANQSVSNLETDLKAIEHRLRSSKVDDETQKRVTLAYNQFMNSERAGDTAACLQLLRDAADNFDKAIAAMKPAHLRASVRLPEERSVGYYLSMEAASARALAASLSDEQDAARLRGEAASIYEKVRANNPEDPTVHMRLGKVIEHGAKDVEDLKRSESLYDEAVKLVDDDLATGPNHWLALSLRIDQGVSLWKQAERTDDPAARLALIERAATATSEGHDLWRKQTPSSNDLNKVIGHKAASNIIFFLARLHLEGQVLNENQVARLSKLVNHVEEFNLEPYADYYKTRDNLMYGYLALGDRPKAAALARLNVEELRQHAETLAGRPLDISAIPTHLTNSAERCFGAALKLLLEGEPPRGSA